ncbi:MAG: anaerobic nitric oxide reductase transcription regulator [Solirubrobacteraceae bacterium]|jgi:hypothetical protein|nr:anaerobic nitric oxide reductase transcription regulator [Solirubrobacteraceae bacterium]
MGNRRSWTASIDGESIAVGTQTAAQQSPWLIAAAHDPASTGDALATLGSFMCVAQSCRAPAGDEPGAIVFDRVDDALLALARETSRAGQRRVLAIAAAAEPLEGGDCRRLLREGMADVVAWNGPAAIRARFDRWQAVDGLVGSPLVADHLESGTGKELTAQLIHTLDQRPNKGDLVVVDCTTIVPSLSGSEFFGHERGAFTAARVGTRWSTPQAMRVASRCHTGCTTTTSGAPTAPWT